MALIVKDKHMKELPEGAVLLSPEKALQYQMSIIGNWPKFSDVLCLKAGPGILGGMTMISSFLINNHFRYKLKLGKYGRLSSYLSVVATPAMISTLFHTTFVQSSVVLRLYDCPVCVQTRAAFIQGGSAVLYPFLLAPLASFMYATRHFTYRLPSITTQTKDVFKLWFKFTKSAGTMASVLLAVNMLGAMIVTAKEMHEHASVNNQLTEYERRFESGSLSVEEMELLVDKRIKKTL